MSSYSSPRHSTIPSSSSNRNPNNNNNNNNYNYTNINPLFSSQWTMQIQDQKVMNKDLSYSSSTSSSSSFDDREVNPTITYLRKEKYETLQKRREAAVILDTPELLLMYANARNDSLAGTRYHFTKIFCGLTDEVEDIKRDQI